MPKRSSKPDSDPPRIIRLVTRSGESITPIPPEKNAAAVSLGRRGGLKGGRARAEALTPEQRTEIARAAAAKRWEKKNGDR